MKFVVTGATLKKALQWMSRAKAEDIEIRAGPVDEIVLSALDPATVVYATATINELLDADITAPESIYVSLEQLYGIVKRISGPAAVVIETVEEGRKLIISTANARYGIQTISPEAIRAISEPARSGRRPLLLTGGEFFEMVTGAATVSDVLTLAHPEVDEAGTPKLVGRGGGGLTEFEYNVTAYRPEKADDVGKGSYPLDYLSRLASVLKITDQVRLVLGVDRPIHISAELELGLDVTALVAPRLRLE